MAHWDVIVSSFNPAYFEVVAWHFFADSLKYEEFLSWMFPELQMALPFGFFRLPPPSYIHLTTAFPKFQNVDFKILEPISPHVWCYIYVSLLTLTLATLLVLLAYIKIMPQSCRVKANDPTLVWLRIIGGAATEAFDGNFFKFGVAGSCLMLIFELLSYSINNIYNVNLRSFIIGEIPEFVPNDYNEIVLGKENVIFSEHGYKYLSNPGK